MDASSSGFGGEQFALPEAVDSLRTARTRESSDLISVAAADPLNLIGIVVSGERVAAVPGKEVRYRNGSLAVEEDAEEPTAVAATPIPVPRKRRVLSPMPPTIPAKPDLPAPTLF